MEAEPRAYLSPLARPRAGCPGSWRDFGQEQLLPSAKQNLSFRPSPMKNRGTASETLLECRHETDRIPTSLSHGLVFSNQRQLVCRAAEVLKSPAADVAPSFPPASQASQTAADWRRISKSRAIARFESHQGLLRRTLDEDRDILFNWNLPGCSSLANGQST